MTNKLKSTRKFNGKIFYKRHAWTQKKLAKKIAEGYREKGFLARVVKAKDELGYKVWVVYRRLK